MQAYWQRKRCFLRKHCFLLQSWRKVQHVSSRFLAKLAGYVRKDMLGFVSSGWDTWKPRIVQDIVQNHTAGLQKGENHWAKRKQLGFSQ